jgi:hypothetical protein
MGMAVVEMHFGEVPMGFSVATTTGDAASMGQGAAIMVRIAAPMDFSVATRAGVAPGNGFLTR